MPRIIQEVYALAGGADCGWHGQEQHWEAGQVIQHMEGKSKPSILVLSSETTSLLLSASALVLILSCYPS